MFSISDVYEDVASGMSIERIHKKYGGITIYIPKVMPDFRERIRQEFNGANHVGLAHKYNISTKTVYEILKEERNR